MKPNLASALIVGAGIAGTSLAEALARRGVATTLLDPAPASGASGNPQSIIAPRINAEATPAARLHAAAARFTLDRLARHFSASGGILSRGALALATDPAMEARLAAMACSGLVADAKLLAPGEVGEAAGLPLALAGLLLHDAAAIDPRRLVAALAGTVTPVPATAATLEPGADGVIALDARRNTTASAEIGLIACGAGALDMPALVDLPLRLSRGQVNEAPATEESAGIAFTLMGSSYLLPAVGGLHLIGATYAPATQGEDWSRLSVADARANLEAVAHWAGPVLGDPDPATLGGRAALRVTTPDHLPLAGPVAEADAIRRIYADLRHGARLETLPPPPLRENLFVLTGLGSRGLSTAPLVAELLASQLLGEPWPVSRAEAEALSPLRFHLRALKRAGGPETQVSALGPR